MEFRWVAAIALWTFLSGPIFDRSGSIVTSRETSTPGVRKTDQSPLTRPPQKTPKTAPVTPLGFSRR
jgi:hypothetical protein